MARFRIIDVENNGHYLRTVPPTEWEQIEVDQKTGKQLRHRYEVPMFLDPRDPGTFNYPASGEIIVSTKADPAYPRDIVFLGPPTQGMEPLDAEAERLIAKTRGFMSPMGPEAFPATGPSAMESSAGQSDLAKILAQMQGQMTLLIGQNDAMARRIAELEEERAVEDVVLVDQLPPSAQPEVRL